MDQPDYTPARWLDTPSGARLALHEWPAMGPCRAILQINHGLAEHGGRYGRFARFMAERGVHVVAPDHRGHGQTTAQDGGPARFADEGGWDKLIDDVRALNTDLRTRHRDVPLILFGHSMGGLITLNAIQRHPDLMDGAAIWNSNPFLGANAPLMKAILFLESLFVGRNGPSHIIRALTFKAWNNRFPDKRNDSDWLSRDHAETDAFQDDPLCGFAASVSLWRDFIRGAQEAVRPASLSDLRRDLPIDLVGGTEDPATFGGKATRQMHRHLEKHGFTHVSCRVLEGFRHETLNELGRENEMNRFAEWFERAIQR